ILLAIAGVALILIGVIGKLKFKDWFDIDTKSVFARSLLFVLGIGLIGFAYWANRPEIKEAVPDTSDTTAAVEPVSTEADRDENADDSQTPADASAQVIILNPTSREQVSAELDDGAARITVSGEIRNIKPSRDQRIFVFTSERSGSW